MSLQYYNITSIDSTGTFDEFLIDTIQNVTPLFQVGFTIQVQNSSGNDGFYTIRQSSFSGNTTTVEVEEPINSSTADGTINLGVMDIQFADTTKDNIRVAPYSLNTETPLIFPGLGTVDYGIYLLQNQLRILENFAGTTAPSNPIVGMQWYDVGSDSTKTFNGSSWSSSAFVGADDVVFTDSENSNTEIYISGSDSLSPDYGMAIRPQINPPSEGSIFRVLDDIGTELLRVEYDGALRSSNALAIESTSEPSTFAGGLSIGSATLPSNGDKLNVTGSSYFDGNVTINGTLLAEGIVNLDGNKIINSAEPTDPQDGVTKNYADNTIATAISQYMPASTVIPITRVGALDSLTLPISHSSSSYILTTTADIPVFINGEQLVIPSGTTLDLESEVGTPSVSNVTLFVNVVYGATVELNATTTLPIDTPVSMTNIGTVTTNGSGVIASQMIGVSKIDQYRPNVIPTPNSLVVTDNDGYIDRKWLKTNITTTSAANYTLQQSDVNGHKTLTNATTVIVPYDATGSIPVGSEFSFRQGSTGVVEFDVEPGVTLESANDYTTIKTIHGRCRLIKEGNFLWSLSGDLGPNQVISTTTPTSSKDNDVWVQPQ